MMQMEEGGRPAPAGTRIGGLALGLCLALFGVAAHAHPHAWIDVRSTLVMSPEGMVAAIEEEWLFDDLYSAAVIDETVEGSETRERTIGEFAPRVIENLGPYGYFMRVTADGRPVRLGTVTQFKSEMRGPQLLLSFTAPLAEPVDPRRRDVQFSVYDPTYFIQMTHRPEDPPAIKGDGRGCTARVEQPKPSAEAIARAFALDRAAAPQDDLGDLFAEKVHIQCK